jgi:hypothetical protein
MGRTLDLPSVIELTPCKYKRVYFYFGVQKKLIFIYLFFFYFYFLGPNEIKVLLMANVHGGNLHHIYADTEILSARLLIILSMAR